MNENAMMKKARTMSSKVRGWTGGGERGNEARRLFNLTLENAQAKAICRDAVNGQTSTKSRYSSWT